MASENEALGRVTIEGLASGLIVIGYSSPSTKELLSDSRGMLYSPNSSDQIANAIRSINRYLKDFDPVQNRVYVEEVFGSKSQSRDFSICFNKATAHNYINISYDYLNHYLNILEKNNLFFTRKEMIGLKSKKTIKRLLPSHIRKITRNIIASL
jgi:hypothetical protein